MVDPVDSAWRTRIPPGWIQFPDGSVGPPNRPSPIDQGWPTRMPLPAGPLAPGALVPGGGAPLAPPSAGGGNDPLGFELSGQRPGGALSNPGGPDIFAPGRSNVGTGKEVGPRTNPFTDANTIDPEQLKNASRFNLPALLRSNPILAGLYAAMYATPADTGELPLSMSGAGRMPQPAPTNMPQDRPSYAGPPAPLAAPLPPPRPRAAPSAGSAPMAAPLPPPRPVIDPAAVDLGHYRAGVGNARTPTYVPGGQTAAPDIFRGLLAQRPN